jgi:pilus assembly protein FimV
MWVLPGEKGLSTDQTKHEQRNMSKETHTLHEKGQAVFLAALMVLSVFAMSAAFAGAAAAQTETDPSNDYTLTVTANEGDGTNIDDANVTISDENGNEVATGNTSDSSGSFELGNGTYTVAISAEDYQDKTEEVTIDGEDAEVTVALSDAGSLDESNFGGSLFWAGEEFTVTGLDANENVQLRSGSPTDSNNLEEELTTNGAGEVTIDTEGLDGSYYLSGAGASESSFEVAEQSLDTEWSADSVENDGEADFEIDSNRGTYAVTLTSEELSADEISTLFGDDVESNEDDVAEVQSQGDQTLTSNFSEVDATGNVTITAEVTDTTASDDATISVDEEVEPSAEFDSSTYSEEAGDIVAFTVDLQGTDSATVDLMEGDENYNATVEVTDGNDDGEVTVYFNTYNAGQGGEPFSVADDSEDSVNLSDETNLNEEKGSDYRLLPADFNLELSVDDEETDLATLVLNDGSTGDIDTAVAPAGADISSDVDDLENATTTGSDVANGDQLVIGVDVSGVFGQLANDDFDSSDLNLTVEQSNPERYTSANTIENFDVVTDADSNRIYFVVDTTNENIDADQEYDVTFSVSEDYVDSYSEDDDNNAEEAETSFSVVERNIEVTGDFNDDDVLQVENDENATVTGESNAAPGTDVQIRLRATGDDPFLMSQTVEVGDEGAIESTFDLSDYEAGQNFTVRMTDNNGEEEVQQQVDATLVESAGQPHTVTITVEDADGNAVSGADVSVADQTETTGDDGQVTFELWHGEYDVTATHDGEETTGTLTINDEDDTTDEGTLVLGEENENINDADDQNQDDNNNDEKNGDDNNDGSGDDSEGEDQPGFGIAVALIALLAAAGIALRNRA